MALRRYATRLDEQTRVDLAEAISAELSRLQALVDPVRRTVSTDFDLQPALDAVLCLERSMGTEILVDIDCGPVRGDPRAVAEIVQNLLANARSYASGSPVILTTRHIGDRVELHLADAGPGIGDEERVSIFDRGGRGRSAAGTEGTGMGLYLSSRLAVAMGGSLRLAPSDRGACFVLELPMALNRLDDLAPSAITA